MIFPINYFLYLNLSISKPKHSLDSSFSTNLTTAILVIVVLKSIIVMLLEAIVDRWYAHMIPANVILRVFMHD